MVLINTYACDSCGNDFEDYPSKAKRRKNNFCSRRCHDEFRRVKTDKTCVVCGKKWEAIGASSKEFRRTVCSESCKKSLISKTWFKKGVKPHNFKGYRVSTQGYVFIHRPSHRLANSDGYVKRANLVMEYKIRRTMDKGEVVHHIDGNKLNDSPENLMLFPSDALHQKFHYVTGSAKIKGAPLKKIS